MDSDVVMITQAVDEEDPVLGFTRGWVNALADNVRRLSVYCLRAGKCELRNNVSLHVLGEGKRRRVRRLRKGLKADLRGLDIGAVFAHMCPRYAVAARWVVGRRVPILLWYAHSAKSMWLRLGHAVSRVVLTPTAESCPIRSEKVRVVGHGIDTERFSPAPTSRDNGILLLSAGRITPVKRYEFLVEAVVEAVRLIGTEKFKVRIVGSPSTRSDEGYFSRLKEAVRKSGLEEVMEFRPAVPYSRIEKEYADCDMFVNTAIGHSIDKAPLEAMACGRVVLTCNRNFLAVLGKHAELLVADDRDPADLGRKIVNAARMMPSERETLGLALREIVVRDHNLNRLMERVVEMIAGLWGA